MVTLNDPYQVKHRLLKLLFLQFNILNRFFYPLSYDFLHDFRLSEATEIVIFNKQIHEFVSNFFIFAVKTNSFGSKYPVFANFMILYDMLQLKFLNELSIKKNLGFF